MMRKYVSSILFVLLFVLVLHWGCDQSKQGTGGMQFRVNQALLGEAVDLDSLGFKLQAPADWNRLPDEVLVQMHEKLQGEDDRLFRFTPLRFYINQSEGCVLSISRVHFDADSGQTDFYSMYHASLKQKFPNGSIHHSRYFKDEFDVNQLFLQIQEKVVIKILFEDNQRQRIQMDYMVPKDTYKVMSEYIESSIGTLKKLNN